MKRLEGSTSVTFGESARSAIMDGISVVANAVGSTLGPLGRCVIIEQEGMAPHVTKDGVTVSRSISLRDPLRSLGAELVKEAASQTNDHAGDGTTTATILTHAMCESGQKLIAAGHPPVKIAKEISVAVDDVVERLIKLSREVKDDELERIATISANGEKDIGKLIAEAVNSVGRDGIVTVEESKSSETELDIVKGMRLDHGFVSPYFVNDSERMRCVMEDAYVLVTDCAIASLADFVPIMEAIHKQGKAFIIISADIEGEALQMLVLNRMKNDLQCCAVLAPTYDMGSQRTEALIDLCTLVGATFCTDATGGLKSMKLSDLGRCRRIVVNGTTTTFVTSGSESKISERADAVRSQLNDPMIDESTAEMLRDRLARLAGSAAVIRVGGNTEIEALERRDRVDDALNATRAAVEEGIVPGGGTSFLDVLKDIEENRTCTAALGEKIVLDALRTPLKRIARNAGESPEVVVRSVIDSGQGIGYDAYCARFVDMVTEGIIDPVKVSRVALQKAASVACTFLTLNAAIVSDDESD